MMHLILIIVALVSPIVARPDVSHLQGYQYDQPNDNIGKSASGFSSVGTSNNHNEHNLLGSSEDAITGSIFHGISSYEAPLHVVSGNNIGSFGNSGTAQEINEQHSNDAQIHRGETQVIDLSGGSSTGSSAAFRTVYKQGPPEITKSIYIHEAQEEKPNFQIQEKQIEVRPKKHYNIIFVKVPSENGILGGSPAPVFPQNEEKTIIYVLSKKNESPDENGEIPTPPPLVTSKPEVFFIKYKNQEDSESVVNKIQESFEEGGKGFQSPSAFAQNIASHHSASTGGGYSPIESSDIRGTIPNGYFSDAEVQPQRIVEVSDHQTTLNANYLPPNKRI